MIGYEKILNEVPYIDRGGIKKKLKEENKKHSFSYLHIEGQAGMGKTRLVSEFLQGIQKNRLIYTHTSMPNGLAINSLAHAILQKFRDKCDLDEFLSSVSGEKKLKYEAILKDIKNNDAAYLTIENLSCDLFFYISSMYKIVFVIEDLHWRDENRDTFLKKILNNLRNEKTQNILIITTSREPVDYGGSRLGESIKLKTLSTSERTALIKANNMSPSFFDEYVEDLAISSKGNPYFINEAIKLFNQSDSIDHKKSDFPENFSEIFKYQLNELNTAEEQVMLASSVIGYRVTRQEILALLPELSLYIDSTLKSLVVNGHLLKIENSLDVYEFYHAIKQESFYELIDDQSRVAWHYALHNYYKSQNIKSIKNKFELCGYHALHAKAYTEALPYLWYCGKQALQSSEPKKAEFLLSGFLKCAHKGKYSNQNKVVRITLERCRAFLMQGNVKLAQEDLSKLESRISTLTLPEADIIKWKDQISVLKVLLLWLNGAFDKEDLLSLRSQFTGNSEVDITNSLRLSLMMIDIGEYREAIDFFEYFIESIHKQKKYRNSGFIWSAEMICYGALANSYAGLGNKKKTVFYIEKNMKLIEKCDHPPQKMYGLTFGAKALQIIGQYQDAAPLIQEAYQISQNYSVGIIKPVVLMQYAIHLTYHDEDYLTALSLLDEYLSLTEFSDFSYAKMMVKKSIADIYIKMGLMHVAFETLQSAEVLARESKNEYILKQILSLKKETQLSNV